MKLNLAAVAALLWLGVMQTSSAVAEDAQGGRILNRLDTNGDGVISKAEATAARERLFARLDLNRDGVIDRDEMEEARDRIMDRAVEAQTRLAIRWRRMDTDHNGSVSVEEFGSRTALFDLADRNSDGELSASEIAAIRDLFPRIR